MEPQQGQGETPRRRRHLPEPDGPERSGAREPAAAHPVRRRRQPEALPAASGGSSERAQAGGLEAFDEHSERAVFGAQAPLVDADGPLVDASVPALIDTDTPPPVDVAPAPAPDPYDEELPIGVGILDEEDYAAFVEHVEELERFGQIVNQRRADARPEAVIPAIEAKLAEIAAQSEQLREARFEETPEHAVAVMESLGASYEWLAGAESDLAQCFDMNTLAGAHDAANSRYYGALLAAAGAGLLAHAGALSDSAQLDARTATLFELLHRVIELRAAKRPLLVAQLSAAGLPVAAARRAAAVYDAHMEESLLFPESEPEPEPEQAPAPAETPEPVLQVEDGPTLPAWE